MSDPAPLAEARELIRAGRFDAAVERLVAALPDLPVEYHRQACAYAGFAHYFAERWTESLGYFQSAARGARCPRTGSISPWPRPRVEISKARTRAGSAPSISAMRARALPITRPSSSRSSC